MAISAFRLPIAGTTFGSLTGYGGYSWFGVRFFFVFKPFSSGLFLNIVVLVGAMGALPFSASYSVLFLVFSVVFLYGSFAFPAVGLFFVSSCLFIGLALCDFCSCGHLESFGCADLLSLAFDGIGVFLRVCVGFHVCAWAFFVLSSSVIFFFYDGDGFVFYVVGLCMGAVFASGFLFVALVFFGFFAVFLVDLIGLSHSLVRLFDLFSCFYCRSELIADWWVFLSLIV
ncbi:hypothetical protein [Lysinibacillus fusiformis]|uniref:hypothetical protein n=1 Tax=Lysinibacillus fusiformis TaxID=28031 RepID=UPI000B8013E2|nr:hypothetical protein [Lysinibacillus fusiformis]